MESSGMKYLLENNWILVRKSEEVKFSALKMKEN